LAGTPLSCRSTNVVIERRAIEIQGTVQGVGFRPFVYRLACRLGLGGFVRNRAGSVVIEAEGTPGALDRFLEELQNEVPPLAKIDRVSHRAMAPKNNRHFTVEASEIAHSHNVAIAPDIATCPACFEELFDPNDRRYRYPFINCTDCGPRLTIVQGVPYDRARTTMSGFTMCAACRAEYDDPANRRFHAQPIACWDCGPRLALHTSAGERVETADPLTDIAQVILDGRIGAIKGLGGFHLVCDARREDSIGLLRQRKQRDEKPFAVMVGNLETAERLCHIDAQQKELLRSSERPIVLLRKRTCGSDSIAASIAPSNPYLGIILPYTPLHHLLLHEVGGIPLVMTSGNRSDEPIAYRDDNALGRLRGIADVFLTHDRPIHVRCDDSVTRVIAASPSPIRRSRGCAPSPISLPVSCSATALAVGGQFKGVFALGRGHQALLSHHLGDLDQLDAYCAFERDVELYIKLFDSQPEMVVHDLHPDYASTHYARRYAAANGMGLLAVQHHHAHVASCMADNGLNEPVIGVAFDGAGFGADGAVWGGEFLIGDYAGFTRAAHLRYVRMPGGEKAIVEPWRMAEAHLADAGMPSLKESHDVSPAQRATIRQLIRRGFNSPWTSSAGRLFDAVAALVGLRQRIAFEGQAAMELEWLATQADDESTYPFAIELPADVQTIDTRPLIAAIAREVQLGAAATIIARRFHNTLVEAIAQVCDRFRLGTGIASVVTSGGVFQNVLLASGVRARLAEKGFHVYAHRQTPANDGGLSLGQLAIAAATIHRDAAGSTAVPFSCEA